MTFEREELRGGRLLEAVQPPLELSLDRDGVELVPALSPPAPDDDDACALEHCEVLHHRESRQPWEDVAQLRRRLRSPTQCVEKGAAMG
jgi:hypothetical protein